MSCPDCAGKSPANLAQAVKCVEPTLFHRVIRPASLGDDTATPPEELDYRNVLLVYEANGVAYLYSSDGVPTFISYLPPNVEALWEALEKLEAEIREELAKLHQEIEEEIKTGMETLRSELADETANREQADADLKEELTEEINTGIANEANLREAKDTELQQTIEALEDRSDVVDVVGTHAELEDYDTTNLGDNDVIKVLNDETHEGAITYYRWNKTAKTWAYVGETGPYYTKSEMDTKFEAVDHDIENLTTLMPTVQNEYGDSEADVLSQKFLSDKLNSTSVNLGSGYTLPSRLGINYSVTLGDNITLSNTPKGSTQATPGDIIIGRGASTKWSTAGTSASSYNIAIGKSASAASSDSTYAVAIGESAEAVGSAAVAIGPRYLMGGTYPVTHATGNSVALGSGATANNTRSVALGSLSTTDRDNEVSIGGDAGIATRYLANVTAGIRDTDAVNLAQVKDLISGMGPGVTLLTGYTASPAADAVYDAAYTNSRLNNEMVILGKDSVVSDNIRNDASKNTSVVLGYKAKVAASTGTFESQGIAIGNDATAGTNTGSTNVVAVAIGYSSRAYNCGVAVGRSAIAYSGNNTHGVALGYESQCTSSHSVALGSYSVTTRRAEVSIGGYSGTVTTYPKTRFLANVTAGELDTDAVNLAQVRDMISQAGGSITALQEYTAEPEENDVYSAGYINNRLDNTGVRLGTNNKYPTSRALAEDHSIVLGDNTTLSNTTTGGRSPYIFDIIIGSGASSTWSTAGTGSASYNIAIGYKASASSIDSTYAIAIGKEATANARGAVALGPRYSLGGSSSPATTASGLGSLALGMGATTNHEYSVALGGKAITSREQEVSVGNPNDTNTNVNYRYVANVKDGVLDHDAVTVHQLNEAVGNINALLETLISGEGAK